MEIVSVGVPSLEHIAAVKITTMLWKQVNIETLMNNVCDARWRIKSPHFCREDKRQWIMREQEVREKVPELPLPELLKTKILGFVKPIGMEMVKWKEFHVLRCKLEINFPNEFCWNPYGRIDHKKTAELMIQDNVLSAIDRYYVACLYCLEASVVEMWNTMPAELRRSIYYSDGQTNKRPLVSLWTQAMKERMLLLDDEFARYLNIQRTPYTYGRNSQLYLAFKEALHNGNKTATDYIWPKVTTEERNITLDRPSILGLPEFGIEAPIIFKDYHIDMFYFLLSQQNASQQRELLEHSASIFLRWHLDWPWQDLFLPMANYLQHFGVNYKPLLEDIVDKILNGHEDYNYLYLFTQLWRQLPVTNQKQVIHEFASSWKLLQQLCLIGEKGTIELILKNATLNELENIISFYPNCLDITIKRTCCDMINTDFYAEEVCSALYFFLNELYTKKARDK